jgi:hypothetical protein
MVTVNMGRYGAVGTATCYGLDRPKGEFLSRRDFRHSCRPAVGPTDLLYKGRGYFSGVGVGCRKRHKRGVDHPLQPSAEDKEKYSYAFTTTPLDIPSLF